MGLRKHVRKLRQGTVKRKPGHCTSDVQGGMSMEGGGTERHQTLPGGFRLLPAQGYNLTAPEVWGYV